MHHDELSGANPRGGDINLRSGPQMEEYRAITERIRADGPPSILDWGCGYGQVTSLLHDAGLNVTAFDYNPDVPQGPRPMERYPHLAVYLSGEPWKLPYADDVVRGGPELRSARARRRSRCQPRGGQAGPGPGWDVLRVQAPQPDLVSGGGRPAHRPLLPRRLRARSALRPPVGGRAASPPRFRRGGVPAHEHAAAQPHRRSGRPAGPGASGTSIGC